MKTLKQIKNEVAQKWLDNVGRHKRETTTWDKQFYLGNMGDDEINKVAKLYAEQVIEECAEMAKLYQSLGGINDADITFLKKYLK